MLHSFMLVLALSGTGQVPDAYIEVARPPVVVQSLPKVTVEEQPPLIIPQPPLIRITTQPSNLVEQEPMRVPVYRLPAAEVRVYKHRTMFYGLGTPVVVESVDQAPAGNLRIKERYNYRVRRGFFGR